MLTKNSGETTVKYVVYEALFLVAAAAVIRFYCQNPVVMPVFIGVNIAARFLLIGRKNDWMFFVIGFVFGGGNDLISMLKGVYYYTPPHLPGVPIPIWMLFFWGHIVLAFRRLFDLPQFRGPAPEGKPWKVDARLAADIATAIALRIVIYNTVKHEPWPTIGYALVVGLRFLLIRPTVRDWKLIGVVMIIGPAFEAALIKFGLYVYFDPVFLGMPAWLLIYWAFIIPVLMKGVFDRMECSLELKGKS